MIFNTVSTVFLRFLRGTVMTVGVQHNKYKFIIVVGTST